MEILEIIIISLISGSSGGGLLYLYFSEKIKSKIQHEYNLKFEFARKELEQKATKFQIQYSKLHIDRAEKLKGIYGSLLNAEESLKYFTHIAQGAEWITDTSREERANKNLANLKEISLRNRIYFEEDLCIKLEKIIEDFDNVIFEMKMIKGQRIYETSSGHKEKPTPLEKWIELGNKVNTEMVGYRKSIEIEFRRILGINE